MKNTVNSLKLCLLFMLCIMGAFGGSNVMKASVENITLHVWVSETPMGECPSSPIYQSKWIYLCYELLDSSGNKIGNNFNNYQVTMYQYSPTNEKLNQHTYYNSDYNWIAVKNNAIGRFTGKVYVTGSITMDCGVDWYQNDSTPTLSLSKSNVSLHTKDAKSSTVTCEVGGDIFDYSFHLTVSNSNPSVVSTSWGAWYSNSRKCDLKITAKTAGSSTLTVKFVKSDGTVWASKMISVKVTEPKKNTYVVSYNANGGIGAPSSQTKTEGINLRLSSYIPSKSYTINYVTGYSASISSRKKGCIFNNWNTSLKGIGTMYTSGALYTKDTATTLYAMWTDPKIISGDLPVLSRDGYDFLGWYTAPLDGSKVSENSIITSDLTLYAHWTSKSTPKPTSSPKPTESPTPSAAPIVTTRKLIADTVIILGTTSYTYDGTEKKPSVNVKDGTTTLVRGTDYAVSYNNNISVGTATVTITGKGNYTGTVKKTFTINARVADKKPFEWGKCNWSFDNSSRYFLNYDVNSDVMDKMKKDFNLSNSDIVELKWNIAQHNKAGFNGSCFGMTVSEIMAHQGDLKLSRYGGNDIVNKNKNTSNMTSVINFIQELQSNSEMCQSIRQTPFLNGDYSQKEFISKLSDVATNSNYIVKLAYKIVTKNTNNGSSSDGYHAVLVYGIEKCNYYSSVTGKTYDRKILIADPNYLSGNIINNDACLYFKSSDSSWIVPYWNKTYSTWMQSCYWNAENGTSTSTGGIQNIMRYESLKEEVDLMAEYSAGHYIAGLEIDNISKNVSSVEKVKNSGNPNVDYAGDFSEEIVRYDIDMDDDIYITGKNELYALWNPTSSYILSYLKPSNYNLKMDYETVDYYADVTNSTYTLFKPSGSIALRGSDADYDITMVTDDSDCVTDWYSVSISGTDVDNLVYAKVENGYTLSASNLKKVKISAEGENSTASTTFSTDYDDVFIYEIDRNTIGVKVDTDQNGTYETPINTEHTHEYSEDWKSNDTSHWKECKCGQKSEIKNHDFKWIVDQDATKEKTGIKHEECAACGYIRNKNTIIEKELPGEVNLPTVSLTTFNKDIKIGKVKITTCKSKKKKRIELKWKKIKNVKGYQIQYSMEKNFPKKKSRIMKSNKVTLKKLKKKNTYYIRVRAYKLDGSKKVYGSWSKVKKVKVKK